MTSQVLQAPLAETNKRLRHRIKDTFVYSFIIFNISLIQPATVSPFPI